MDDQIGVGNWVYTCYAGIWRVWRVLSGFQELRYSVDAPKQRSSRTLYFAHRLVNTSWKRSFSSDCFHSDFVCRIAADDEVRVLELLESDPALHKAFEKYAAANNSLDLVVNVSMGNLPADGCDGLKAVCEARLGTSGGAGMRMDEVLTVLRETGYHDCIGKWPVQATLQLVSENHTVREGEFVLRYERVLDR